MSYPVVHFEILGKEGKSLQKFYRSLFRWNIDNNNPIQYGLVKKEKRGIEGGIATAEDGNARVTVYIEVPSPDVYLKKAEKLGGKIIMPTTTIPGMVTFALFSDPDGNVIGLIKAKRRR